MKQISLLAVLLAGMTCAGAGTLIVEEEKLAPFILPSKSVVREPAPQTSVTPAAPQQITFTLLPSDRSVKNTFLRWATEQKQQVVWRLSGDVPLDASGQVNAVNLADAMTQTAAAFADKPEPFVIREYDNVIVVMSRWAARP